MVNCGQSLGPLFFKWALWFLIMISSLKTSSLPRTPFKHLTSHQYLTHSNLTHSKSLHLTDTDWGQHTQIAAITQLKDLGCVSQGSGSRNAQERIKLTSVMVLKWSGFSGWWWMLWRKPLAWKSLRSETRAMEGTWALPIQFLLAQYLESETKTINSQNS